MFQTHLRAAMAVVAIVTIAPAFANLKKAFQALEMHNYFLARELFLKNTRKQPEAAWYGMSVISGRDNNPFYDLDSAYVFIMRSDAAFTMADAGRRRSIAKHGVDQAVIEVQKDHVFERAWEVAHGRNTIASYDRYLKVYKDSPRSGEAIQRRDQLAFQEARDKNTAAAYQAFLNEYPHAREVFEARSRLQEATYRESTQDGEMASYLDFLQHHPESPYVPNAESEIYALATAGRTAEEYRRFIKDHPANHRVADAWRSIYEIYTRDLSVNAITRFLTEHPDYPFVEELVQDYKTASLQLLPFRKDGHWGFIDEDGLERIPADHEWVEPFNGAQALVSMNGKVGTINRSGREVVPIRFDEVLDPIEGMSTVELDERVGAVDRNGELVVPLQFTDVGEFSQKLAYAAKADLYGYINNRGAEVIPFQYLSAGTFRNSLAVVRTDEGYGVIDTRGNIVVPAQYDWIEGFEKEVSRVRKKDLMGLISPFGDEMMPMKYKHIGPFRDGLALVIDGRKCGYVDLTGRYVIPLEYEAVDATANWGDMQNGLAEVQQNGKRCLINVNNKKVMPCQFADIGPTEGALIPFRKRTKWGYADRNGVILFDNRYDQAWEMVDGMARVKNGELFGAIDSTGREVIPLVYMDLQPSASGYSIATDANGSGLLDRQGRIVIPTSYESVSLVNDAQFAKVEAQGKFAYIRLSNGQTIWKEEGFNMSEVDEQEQERN